MNQRRRRMKTIASGALAALVVAALLVLLPFGCSPAPDPWGDEAGSPRIVVTIAPLASFVRAVTGEGVAVRCLCTTTGPHGFIPDTRDARLLTKADLFLTVGLQLDDQFADPMTRQVRRPDLPVVKLGQRVPIKQRLEMICNHDPAAGGKEHNHGKYDPHLWLGIPEVIVMVEAIRDELSAIDPDRAPRYKKNAEAYIQTLKKLHADGKKMLEKKKNRRIVTFHESLGYFARSFALKIAGVIEVAPGEEASARQLTDLVELCRNKKNPVAAIAVEPQYPKSTSATTLRNELRGKGVAIKMIEIDPLETADAEELEAEGAGWYEKRMRRNLRALAEQLL